MTKFSGECSEEEPPQDRQVPNSRSDPPADICEHYAETRAVSTGMRKTKFPAVRTLSGFRLGDVPLREAA
jgi:hypothetical protein